MMRTNIFVARAALFMTVCSAGWSFAGASALNDAPWVTASPVEVSSVVQDAVDVLATTDSAVEPLALDVPQTPTEPVAISGFGMPLASGQLNDFRGGFDVVKNDLQLSGTVADNAAVHVLSGNNSIAEGSFANTSGFPIVIQNSGSNVLIQNATIINLQYQ